MKNIVKNADEFIKKFYKQHFKALDVDFWQQYISQLGFEDLFYEDNSSRFFIEKLK